MQRQKILGSIYSASFFFTLHYAFLLYIGSSYLGQFFSAEIASRAVSSVYVIASILSVYTISKTPLLFKEYGLRRVAYALLWATGITALLLSATWSPWIAIPLFIALSVAQIVLRYVLDVYIERFSTEQTTGHIRGIFLTVINSAVALSPFFVGKIIAGSGFSLVYIFAGILVIVSIATTLGKLRTIPEGHYHVANLWKTAKKIYRRPNLYHIFSVNLILEIFYAWMVIYTPLYLTTYVGFDWSQVGVIFSIMLLPFVLIELPAGYLADKYYGEKEMLLLGLIIMGTATIGVAYMNSYSVALWALLLFTTRIGAALIEIMSDTYFFKKVHPDDTDIIGLYRSAKPIATMGAPILAGIILTAGTYQTLYLTLGFIVLYGLRHALAIKDTK